MTEHWPKKEEKMPPNQFFFRKRIKKMIKINFKKYIFLNSKYISLWPVFGHGRLGHPQSLEYLLILFDEIILARLLAVGGTRELAQARPRSELGSDPEIGESPL